tara:strand:+ start:11019 stop:11396 length:378 start_codon:yes stop_codon:yes gene_type:complete
MTEENTTPETAPTPETTATTPAPEGTLSVADLKMMARVIQVGSERGSFKAEELVTVGGLYEKIVGFLRATGQLDPAPSEAPAPDADAIEKEIEEESEAPAAEMMPEEVGGSSPNADIPPSQDIAQ